MPQGQRPDYDVFYVIEGSAKDGTPQNTWYKIGVCFESKTGYHRQKPTLSVLLNDHIPADVQRIVLLAPEKVKAAGTTKPDRNRMSYVEMAKAAFRGELEAP